MSSLTTWYFYFSGRNIKYINKNYIVKPQGVTLALNRALGRTVPEHMVRERIAVDVTVQQNLEWNRARIF